ncbi:hypothetical protein Tco_1213402 [Tanacetum coccineum]
MVNTWDNAKRVNQQKISNNLKYPQDRRTFVPLGVLTRIGLDNPVRPNGKRAIHTVSIARPISTDRPISTARPLSTARKFAPKIAQTGSAIRPIYPRMDNIRPRASYSPIKERAIQNAFYKIMQWWIVVARSYRLAIKLKIFQTIKITMEHCSSEKDKEPTQEYILLPLHPHRPGISLEDVVQAAQEKPSENLPKDNNVQDSEDVAEKEEQHKQAFEEEKKKAAQATSINKLNTRRPSVSTSNSPLVSTANIPYASAASTPTGANTGRSSFVYLGGQIPIDASTLSNTDLPIDPNMPNLEDDSNVFPNNGIFSGAYDDKDVGVEADFNNMDNTIDVSPIPTLRVHKDHPKGQILGDPKSAVQTRGKIQKASSVQQALLFASFHGNSCPTKWMLDEVNFSLWHSIEERSMIGSLMYLTASRPDIMFTVCACARFQITPKASHLNALKRIFRGGKSADYFVIKATYGAELVLVLASIIYTTAKPTFSTARLSLCCSKVLDDGNAVWIG